jgi:LemA protein
MMTPVLIASAACAVFFVMLALFVIGLYNQLVANRNRVQNAYAQIDVQLKRRYDLIPNLVEAVKGYMSHERGTLEAVIEARNSAFGASKAAASSPGDPAAMQKLSQAEGQLNGALGRLFALSEAYPDLKANQNMLALQEELVSTENKVGFARQGYNDAVMYYNTRRESFPNIVVANFLGFGRSQSFEIESEKERQAPRVSF